MPPGPSQKGTSKKNATAIPKQSRTSTPAPSSLPPQEFYDPDYLNTRVILLRNLTYEDLVDSAAFNGAIPDLRSIDAMLDKLKSLTGIVEKRSTFYDRGMRHLADERKKRPDDYDRVEPETKRQKHKRKKGSDTFAANDGDQSSPVKDAKRKHSRDRSASSSLSPVAGASPSAMDVDDKESKDNKESKENKDKKVKKPSAEEEKPQEESSSEDDEEPPPKREMPQHQTFGNDPSTFPDPTVYEIRDVHSGMSEEEKKEIFSVAVYPQSDLRDMIPGDPPDKDFSSAKPTSQINFSTFSSYIDPYFRHFAEEDIAFLRERGDRVTPFLMPPRGKRHYSEIWAEEDGSGSLDAAQQARDRLAPNQSRGNIESMNDNIAETDQLSIGPLASRLLQTLRPENRAPAPDDKPAGMGLTNGDMMTNGEINLDDPLAMPDLMNMPMSMTISLPSATFMIESGSEAWKKATHPKLDYAQVDERLKQELKYLGFLPDEGYEPNYNDHQDDEVAARLRLLQERLREQILVNGARKAKLMELVRERMAHQEYQTILEDLDGQVQAAYLKRTRTMGKSKKTKRPGGAGGGSHFVGGVAGGAGGGGTARPGIGDLTKTLMERRKRWIDTIGPVFDAQSLNKVPREADPDSSIFGPGEMAMMMKREKEQWDEEVDEE